MNTARKPFVPANPEILHVRKISQEMAASQVWEVMALTDQRTPDGAEIWQNYLYVVTCRRFRSGWAFDKSSPWASLGIYCHNGAARHDWREFQKIKNDVAGPEWEAVELYPKESRLLDPSNYYMIWCAPNIRLGKFVPRTIIDEVNCVAPQRPWHPKDKPPMTQAGKEKQVQAEIIQRRRA
jgi:hypothetical protein